MEKDPKIDDGQANRQMSRLLVAVVQPLPSDAYIL